MQLGALMDQNRKILVLNLTNCIERMNSVFSLFDHSSHSLLAAQNPFYASSILRS